MRIANMPNLNGDNRGLRPAAAPQTPKDRPSLTSNSDLLAAPPPKAAGTSLDRSLWEAQVKKAAKATTHALTEEETALADKIAALKESFAKLSKGDKSDLLRAQYLEKKGVTEAQIKAMSREDREKIESEIKDYIKRMLDEQIKEKIEGKPEANAAAAANPAANAAAPKPDAMTPPDIEGLKASGKTTGARRAEQDLLPLKPLKPVQHAEAKHPAPKPAAAPQLDLPQQQVPGHRKDGPGGTGVGGHGVGGNGVGGNGLDQ